MWSGLCSDVEPARSTQVCRSASDHLVLHALRSPCLLCIEKVYDKGLRSPALSDGTSSAPFTSISPALISIDPDKMYDFPTPSQSALGGSSNRGAPDLRPTPYLVPRDSTTSLSEMGRSKKHAHQLSNTSASVSTSDVRAMSVNATQLGSNEAPQAAHQAPPREDGPASGNVIGFGGDGVVLEGSERDGMLGELEASDVRSDSGETTLPPPYADYRLH